MWVNRSWRCVFRGHDWIPITSVKMVKGFGKTEIVDHYSCRMCGRSKM